MGALAEEVVGVLALCIASLVTTVLARPATVSPRRAAIASSGWKQVISFVFSLTSSWARGQAGGVLQRGEQVGLAAPGSGCAAQALAVHCEAAQPGCLRSAVGKPASDRPVQRVVVDAGQQSTGSLILQAEGALEIAG
ncbi:hypothetical protein PV518_36515 [Streptomyces sp. ND04-05B]|uniref:hypothetical protein n=1 Tax=Streptomyces sp. ND04-05B TaxID=3028693 RepID=UPI0029BF57B1|nr:hypothetical protein [Streptomyces sp. ND04-05B]MDX3067607.1 hypothetical protein [Streptomyces sp. ND04-05B]